MSNDRDHANSAATSNNLDALSKSDFQALAQSGRELAKELALDTLLMNILDTASKLTDSPETSIILNNENQPTLYFAAATGDEAEWVLSTFGVHSDKQIPINGSKAGSVYQSGVSLVENVVENNFSGVDKETKKVTKSMVCVPLNVGEQRLGVIQVLNKTNSNYTARDKVILEFFADQASVAIRNARLMENMLAHSGFYGGVKETSEMFARMEELNEPAKTEVLSVMFADMRGFTQMCQALGNPVIVQERLSEFISMLSETVIDCDGIVNKFLGDGLMALFQGSESSANAVRCAFSMVEQFAGIKEHWNETSNQQLDFLDIGIGISTDQVILGGIGNSTIRDYTAIGTAVNLASAFEYEAREGRRILCDQLTYRNTAGVVSGVDDSTDYLLKKPGQDAGVMYKCYHLKTLGLNQRVRLFVSHSTKDKQYVSNLVDGLNQIGIQTWYSVTDIPKGAMWTAEIRKAIARSNWMIVVVSKNSAKSKWIQREVDLALAAEHLEDRIIPIVVDETSSSDVNDYLAAMQAIEHNESTNVIETLAARFTSDAETQ